MSEAILANLPAILLMVVGFILVVIEMYVPGFGFPGITGTICLIAGVILKAKSPVEALLLAVVIIALLCIALSISIHSISKGQFSKSRLVLNETSVNGGENAMDYYIGREGVTVSVLRPAGTAEIEGVRLSVVSDGEFIGSNEKIRVKRVDGNNIVVAKI